MGTWDIFCRVVDNHGDLGVCWRLAVDLAERGEVPRLWIDDDSALCWMAPQGHRGVELIRWRHPPEPLGEHTPGDVVIEAFGCELPAAFAQRMAQRAPASCWINLEYLSAEAYVERSHGLPSPQLAGPAAGLRKWFFYPGFTPRTGGLLREPGLLEHRDTFDRAEWLAARDWALRGGERVVSLFCYEQPALLAWLHALAQQPTLLLATSGHAARQVEALLGPTLALGQLRSRVVAPLAQVEYDHLLWASDLNIVRGEDSFVRAQWAGVPFIWHIYPQDDGAHRAKLEAFLNRFIQGGEAGLAHGVRTLATAWSNGTAPPEAWPDLAAWQRQCQNWRSALAAQDDLATQLLRFVAERR